jgi:hypothetical protein
MDKVPKPSDSECSHRRQNPLESTWQYTSWPDMSSYLEAYCWCCVALMKTFRWGWKRVLWTGSLTIVSAGGNLSPAAGGRVGGGVSVSLPPYSAFLLFCLLEYLKAYSSAPCGGAVHGREWIIIAIAKCGCQLQYCNTVKNRNRHAILILSDRGWCGNCRQSSHTARQVDISKFTDNISSVVAKKNTYGVFEVMIAVRC